VLFLTTNRIGDFDEAFASRIHFSLYYPPLDKDATWQICKNNLDRVRNRYEGKDQVLRIEESDIAMFMREHYLTHPNSRWNGRQIRNACQTALALAEYEADEEQQQQVRQTQATGAMAIDGTPAPIIMLKQKHFETVAEAYRQFNEYVKDITGTYADEKASEDKIRAPLKPSSPSLATSQPHEASSSHHEAGGWVPKEQMRSHYPPPQAAQSSYPSSMPQPPSQSPAPSPYSSAGYAAPAAAPSYPTQPPPPLQHQYAASQQQYQQQEQQQRQHVPSYGQGYPPETRMQPGSVQGWGNGASFGASRGN